MVDIFSVLGLQIEDTVGVGDILTSLTIFTSIFIFFYSQSLDRYLRRKEQADKVRNSAAKTIGKLDRWKEISLSIFHYMDATFVEASDELQKNYKNTEHVKDYLWIELNRLKNQNIAKRLDENIETAYVELYDYEPCVRRFFKKILKNLEKEENNMFEGFLYNMQSDVELFNYKKEEDYNTSHLRNQLVKHAKWDCKRYEKRINKILEPISNDLLNIISENDKDILKKKREHFKIKNDTFADLGPEYYVYTKILFGEAVDDKKG